MSRPASIRRAPPRRSLAAFARVAAPGLVAALALVVAVPGGAARAQASLATTELDCLMEPRTVVRLGSAVTGVLDEVAVDRGDTIHAGQLLATLESGVEEATVALARARAGNDVPIQARAARLEFQRKREERTETLFKKNVVSSEQMDTATTERRLAELDLLEVEMEQGLAKLQLRQATELLNQRAIISPIDGVVVERALSPGAYVNEQSHVFTVAAMEVLNIEVFVPLDLYGLITLGMRGEVRPSDPVGGVYDATVVIIDELFDPASDTFGVRLELPNSDHELPAGLRCKVRFVAE